MKLSLVLFLTVMLVFTTSGCSDLEQNGSQDMPDVLKIGILPGESKEVLLKRYTPLFNYLSKELGVPYELKLSKSYEDLLESFNAKSVDLVYFGGFTFIQAYHSTQAVPLVMRDIDIHFTSYFIATGTASSGGIKSYKGKSFSFGSRLSTSGHLMPRFFLKQLDIIAETFFSTVQYSGSHDKTAYWVRDGVVDIGVANSKIIDKMLLDGRLNPGDITIVLETPPYPDYVWALQSGYSVSVQEKIRNAFLSLTPSSEEHAEILHGVDAGGFIPASYRDYIKLDQVASQLGLLESMSNE